MQFNNPNDPRYNIQRGGGDFYMAKLNNDLSLQWDRLYGGPNPDGAFEFPYNSPHIIEDKDGSLVFATTSNSTNGTGSDMTNSNANEGSRDIWVIKLGYNTTCTPRPVCIKWTSPLKIKTVTDPQPPVPDDDERTITIIKERIKNQLQNCKATNEAALIDEYKKQCGDRNSISEKFQIEYKLKYHHYTLYYYDRAGNLVKTVPPKGVQYQDLTNANVKNRLVHPAHTYVTTYKYNSLGQLLEQNTPDGGTTKFVYNKVGQLRFSQNAKQLATTPLAQHSYTKYDYLGRSIEVGEADLSGGVTFPNLNSTTYLDNVPFGAQSYPTTGTSEETYTVYSEEAGNVNYLGKGQRFLQNRVSYTYTKSLFGDKSVTYFSYDPHGNVEWLIQDIPGLSKTYIGYDYDLISNKVTKVKYNETLPDQFFHKYEYDADNRIVATLTSRNGKIWDKDAIYKYYKHGALKRTEMGEDKLQGLDYAYTLQGWLKGVNTPRLNISDDPGNDGGSGSKFVKDEYGMVLGYFAGDFVRSSSVYNSKASGGNALNLNSSKPLYNGNITSWVSRIEKEYRDVVSPPSSHKYTAGNVFTYDHLNRLLQSDYYNYNGSLTMGSSYTASSEYQTIYSYDANGNLSTLLRKGYGSNLNMDNLSYSYQTGNNKLRQVTDAVPPTSAYTEDLETQPDADNYLYDGIGNMMTDKQEGMVINWNVYGKISEIKRLTPTINTKPEIRFTYDASGNRIRKEVNSAPYNGSGVYQRLPENLTTTYYVRDASGNIMSVYERKNTDLGSGFYRATYKIKELPIFGSSRVGQMIPDTDVASKDFLTSDLDKICFDNTHNDLRTENKTQYVTSYKVDALTDLSSAQRKLRSTEVQDYLNGSKAYPYDDQRFLGTLGNNVATAEDKDGNSLFFVGTAENYWGKSNTCLVYYPNGILLPNSGGISSDAKAKSVIVKRPGKNSQYYLITVDVNKRLTYTVIDKTLPGVSTNPSIPLGDVVATQKNILIDAGTTPYTGELQVIEEYSTGKVYLYASRYVAPTVGQDIGTLELTWFEITENKITQSPKVVATYPALNDIGQSEMQISHDGRKMVLFNHKKRAGWFDHQNTDVYVVPLGYDYKVVNNNVTSNKVSTLGATYTGVSAEFYDGENGRYMYFSRDLLVKLSASAGSERSVVRYDSRNGTETDLANSGDLRRYQGKVLVFNPESNVLIAYSGGGTTPGMGIPLQLSSGFSQLNRNLPIQNHRVYKENILIMTLSRPVDLKRYEMSDHLGNVTVVFSDLKGATITSSVANFITVEDYHNYYPFGMAMPGRNALNPELYRYGFNGMEKDDEIKGKGNSYDFGARVYDPRLGRWLSLDPLMAKYPNLSPFNLCNNNPIAFKDMDGKDFELVIDHKTKTIIVVANLYVTKESTDRAITAVNSINLTESFSYEFMDEDGAKHAYNVKFEITPILSDDPINDAKKDNKGNSFVNYPSDLVLPTIIDDKGTHDMKNNSMNDFEAGGVNIVRKYIFVPPDSEKDPKSDISDVHEILHSVTFEKFHSDFLGSYLYKSQTGGGKNLTNDIVKNILKNSLGNTTDKYMKFRVVEYNETDETPTIPPDGVVK